MSAKPLTRDERDGIQKYGVTLGEMYARLADYEATVQAEEAGRKAAEERYRSAELSVFAGKRRREEAEERTRAADERAHHFLSALESARALIERDVPKEILLDNIRRNLDDAKRGER